MVKFLVIRFSSIGDIVLTTPVVRCLKEQVVDAEVYYLTKEQFAPILEVNPHINKVFTLKANFKELVNELKAEGFDYIVDLHNNLRTLRVKRALRLLTFSFNKLNWEKWLLVNFRINRMPERHIVDRYMDTLHSFSVKDDGKGLEYYISDSERVNMSGYFPEHPQDFVAVVVGGGHATKQIPAHRIRELINTLNTRVVLLGGKEDESKAQEILAQVSATQVKSLVGKLGVNQSASVIQQARLVITPDTGMMHIASAFKRNVISLWGNTVPELGMSPYRPGNRSKVFEVKKLSCRPCSKIGYSKCPKKHFKCMEAQDYPALITYAGELMQEGC